MNMIIHMITGAHTYSTLMSDHSSYAFSLGQLHVSIPKVFRLLAPETEKIRVLRLKSFS